jgi:hypothetical protein
MRPEQESTDWREKRPAKGFWKRIVFQKPPAVKPNAAATRLDERYS